MFIKNKIELKSKIYNHYIFLLLLIFSLGFQFSCHQTNNNVKLFAAAGTMLAVDEICASDELINNISIEKNYAASGALARQIKAGADASVYISANKQWIDFLADNNLLIQNSVMQLAKNKLVVICLKDKNIDIDFCQDFNITSAIHDKISIGDPKYVPVGTYAKQALDSLNWFKQIENQIILAKDVTSVLHYVELGECDWGIVYYSEAIKSNKVKIAYEIPTELYRPIIFYIALLKDNQQSKYLYHYFQSQQAQEIFNKHGFVTVN